ncbi:oxidoreductase mmfh [Streptomyces lucensis JCM 4490]|uniref:Oxidoreductase mmfh n=1 Tax=Streptomyces lucensis JCM 4490 TaxID=1306176 RepID=A0A918JAY1_9ACTN|nr:acyl-CoA dehydrogenase family protein [Streptomyces lucensis]GGW69693.1 oxidoreductase mmfh [Streptomyces lucensis JCM 4490]
MIRPSAPTPGDSGGEQGPSPVPGLAARRAAKVAAWHADEADARRRLDLDVVAELGRAGFNRHFVPAEHGGAQGTFTDLVEAAARLGESCTSAAWVATLFAAHGRIASYLPERARRELWGESPDVRIAAGVAPPRLRAAAVPGGWLLSGEWPNVSGVDFADWVLLAALAERPAGAVSGGAGSADTGSGGAGSAGTGSGGAEPGGGAPGSEVSMLFLVPIEDCEVLDTWNTLGMRGTGSNTVRAGGVHVPGHRAVPRERLLAPREPGAARCHSVPYPLVAALMFAAPVLGAARGALADWTRAAAGRSGQDGRPAASTPAMRTALARSSAELRAAGLLLDGAASRADTARVESLTVAETVRDVVAAVEMCVVAVDRLFRTTGGRGQSHLDPVQRRWRDIQSASTHAMLRFDPSAQSYAQAVLGTTA